MGNSGFKLKNCLHRFHNQINELEVVEEEEVVIKDKVMMNEGEL